MAGSTPLMSSVVVSGVSGHVRSTRAGEKSPGVAAAAIGIGRRVAGRAMIASSSRTSMPTGHHVTHRPQPTQPEVPNWSTQVANLWVSHCR